MNQPLDESYFDGDEDDKDANGAQGHPFFYLTMEYLTYRELQATHEYLLD
jgi:hypothetical protein